MSQHFQQTLAAIARQAQTILGAGILPKLEPAHPKFGADFALPCFMLARELHQSPQDIASQLAGALQHEAIDKCEAVSGFVNIWLSDACVGDLANQAATYRSTVFKNKTVVTEYSDPNPFKVLHAGHLYTSVVGDAIANLVENAGAKVHRVNFGGDVGLHVGKTMWAILQTLGGEHPNKLADIESDQRAQWLSGQYVAGTAAYEDDPRAKEEIIALNKRVYQLHDSGDKNSAFAQIYWTCRQWSYDYFDEFYERIGSHFEKYYPESLTAPIGIKIVREQLARGVYHESRGAIVFDGEKYGLHTRVFINSEGLPTYEAKDVGLIMAKWDDYHFDHSIIITGNDINEYMKVVLKSIEQFAPDIARRTIHFTHGNVKLQGGVKMSSRKGNILRAVDVLDAAQAASRAATGRDDEQTVLGAIKYSFLKPRIGADIIYDPQESVSLQGNSGPYLQYAHARACSILKRLDLPEKATDLTAFEPDERQLARKIGRYTAVVDQATQELLPHYICQYLYELAQEFNRFYEHNHVVGDARQAIRVELVRAYAGVLKSGLTLLGISAPEKM